MESLAVFTCFDCARLKEQIFLEGVMTTICSSYYKFTQQSSMTNL